jgi:pimeloyl-ACP methyl ester carboxylesterase
LRQLHGDHRKVIVDGKHLETLAYPGTRASNPWIVMLHEGLGSISMWRDFPARLARATGCSVLAYSRYGHGKSDALGERRSVEFMHHEAKVVLPALLECLGIEHPVLLGHSDGGSISLIYAANFQAGPRGLILEAPHVFVEDVTVESISKIRVAQAKTDLRAKLARHHDHADEMFHGWSEIWLDPAFRKWNIEDCLDRVRCPVLVIQGEDDEYGTQAQVAAIQRKVPATQTLTLRNCGHCPHRDQPEATLDRVVQFVGRLL